MNYSQLRFPHLATIFLVLFLIPTGCRGLIPGVLDQPTVISMRAIGFDFTQSALDGLEGDTGAPDHVFIHKYPMPGDGEVTGVIYLADSDEVPEVITFLILRPIREGWKVVHSVPLPADDMPASTTGISSFEMASPLPVNEGDVFAHWQPEERPTGPIPQNVEEASVEGRSLGKLGFGPGDVEVGRIISENGFTGRRDYAINVLFSPEDRR